MLYRISVEAIRIGKLVEAVAKRFQSFTLLYVDEFGSHLNYYEPYLHFEGDHEDSVIFEIDTIQLGPQDEQIKALAQELKAIANPYYVLVQRIVSHSELV